MKSNKKYYYIWRVKDLPTYDEKAIYRSECLTSLILKAEELNNINTDDTTYYRVDKGVESNEI